jgi:CRP-like cAMP-binding protein
MSDKNRKLNEEAARLVARGRLDEACTCLEQAVKAEPRDLPTRQKLAEVYAKLGRTADAVKTYQSVAGSYAADGLLLKAIAICKLILRLDPAHTETQDVLAALTTKRRPTGGDADNADVVSLPRSMSAAVGASSTGSAARKGQDGRKTGGGGEEATTHKKPSAAVRDPHAFAAVIEAAMPSLDELIAMTSDHGVQSEENDPVDALSEEVGAGLDLGEQIVTAPLHGASTRSEQNDVAFAADDDNDVVNLSDADIEMARVDVTKIAPIPLFSDLPRDAFLALTERMALRVALPGDVLMAEGEVGSSMFVIIQGRVKVVREDSTEESKNTVELATLSDGTFFGEGALLSDAPRTASVVCADETMLFEISRELVAQMTVEHPSVGDVMRRFHKNRLITNLLKTSVIFAPFSTEKKKSLIERFKSRQVEAGTDLLTRERPGDGLYVLLSGHCEVLAPDDNGKDVVVAELKPGDAFGEMSVLWNTDTNATVRTTSTSVVLRLPRHAFADVIKSHPELLQSLAALSDRRQRKNSERQKMVPVDLLQE